MPGKVVRTETRVVQLDKDNEIVSDTLTVVITDHPTPKPVTGIGMYL